MIFFLNLVMLKIILLERGLLKAKRRTKDVRRENATTALFEEKFIFTIQPKSLFSNEISCQIYLFSKSRIGLSQTYCPHNFPF